MQRYIILLSYFFITIQAMNQNISLSEQVQAINATMKTLVHATKRGNEVLIRDVIEQYPHFVNIQDKVGNTLLHYAVMYNHISLVKLFLEKGAQRHISNIFKDEPLYYAQDAAIKKALENEKSAGIMSYYDIHMTKMFQIGVIVGCFLWVSSVMCRK